MKVGSISPVQVEGEDVLLHLFLAHDVVKHRIHPVHRESGVSHAEDPIELGCDEGHTGLLDGLTEQLLLHRYVSNLDKQERNVKQIPKIVVHRLYTDARGAYS